jgi:hypothetical protein
MTHVSYTKGARTHYPVQATAGHVLKLIRPTMRGNRCPQYRSCCQPQLKIASASDLLRSVIERT